MRNRFQSDRSRRLSIQDVPIPSRNDSARRMTRFTGLFLFVARVRFSSAGPARAFTQQPKDLTAVDLARKLRNYIRASGHSAKLFRLDQHRSQA
jgi:hypothetical protein